MTHLAVHQAFEGSRSGQANMDRDLELADQVGSHSIAIAFRTYTWDPWTISLGKHQSLSVVDHRVLEQRGYHVVQRPTGGRAVFHAQELTYAIVARSTQPRVLYAQVHALLLDSLNRIAPGIFSSQQRPTDLRQHYASQEALGKACYTASASSEIMANGRKVVGSAQRILPNNMILQHGSILCGPQHLEIVELLELSSELRASLLNALHQQSTSMSEAASRTITPTEVADAVMGTFTEQALRNLAEVHFPGVHHAP